MSIGIIIIYVLVMLTVAIFFNIGGWWATLRAFSVFKFKLPVRVFVAVRHLRGRKSGFLTVIGVFSILGVSFSSCMLTTVLSVMGGFSGDLKDKILKTNAHIVIDKYGSDMDGWRETMKQVETVEGVVAATPVVLGEMMMNARTNNHAVLLKGVDLDSYNKASRLFEKIEKGDAKYLDNPDELFEKTQKKRKRIYGSSDYAPPKAPKELSAGIPAPISPKRRTLPTVIVGRELSKSLRLYDGIEVNIISPFGQDGPTGPIPKSKPFRVGGIFVTEMYEYDSLFVYISLEEAQQFLRKGDRISEIHVAVDDPDDADLITERISSALGNSARVRSWSTTNAPLFSALAIEKIVMFILLSMAILVASFCIVATLTMLVLEKGAEVSVLMTLGASIRDVQGIFRFEGFLIGLVGTISGLLVGFGLCMVLKTVGLQVDREVWYMDKLPVSMEWVEFFLVGIASMITTQLATLYPAHAAAKLRPVEGLKND